MIEFEFDKTEKVRFLTLLGRAFLLGIIFPEERLYFMLARLTENFITFLAYLNMNGNLVTADALEK